jgi:hypothetical protein
MRSLSHQAMLLLRFRLNRFFLRYALFDGRLSK